jgi:hypothetical protein
MKIFRLTLLLLGLSLAGTGMVGCNAEKEATERKNLMIPKKSEMMRNSRYKEVEKRKTNKVKKQKRKNKSLF